MTGDTLQINAVEPLAALCEIAQDTTMARAVDVWAVYVWEFSRREWATKTNRERKTVALNVKHGEEDLGMRDTGNA